MANIRPSLTFYDIQWCQTFVNRNFEVGTEFCLADDRAELPEKLFVFINAPMGRGNAPETSGAVDLTHYINCMGDNNCFVPGCILPGFLADGNG